MMKSDRFVFTENSDDGLMKAVGLTLEPTAPETGDGWQTIPPIYIRIDDPHGSYDQTEEAYDLLFG